MARERLSILQFGETGQLARELVRAASGLPDFALQPVGRDRADFMHPEQVTAALTGVANVDVVVNATAYTAVDKAEAEPDLARCVNATAVAALAKACASRRVPLIHVSTDYVFDGTKDGTYREDDAPSPLSVYGRTKLEGENAARSAAPQHVIIRTSWLYSAHGINFVKTMLRLGAERDELRVVADQHGAPTSAANLARAILSIADRIAHDNSAGLSGTFHYADAGETTRLQFAQAIFEDAASWANIKAHIVPAATADFPAPARRPPNSLFDCSKIEKTYGLARQPWRASLASVLEDVRKQGVS
jgi:dTDP-4-dehydrorhamnose reductase